MKTKRQYRPLMRQSERVTSTLAVPLALSSAILVALLALATTPQINSLHHALRESTTTTFTPQGHSGDTRLPVENSQVTQTVSNQNSRSISESSATNAPPPRSTRAKALTVVGEGVLSGGSTSASYVEIAGALTAQLTTDQPVLMSLWDGNCTIDPVHQIITNASLATCTIEIRSDTFMPWQLVQLA